MTDSDGLWRLPGVRVAAFAVLAYLYLPIVVLVVLSFNRSDSTIADWQGLSLRWYGVMAGDADMMRALGHSLMVASVATVLGSAIALMAALGTANGRFWGQGVAETAISLPLIIPDIVAAIAILLFFVMIGLPLGLVSLFLAHTMLAIPIAYLPIRARLQGMDQFFAEAAADLYAPPWRSFQRITLPLIWPGIVSGAMLAFVGSLGDVVISYFVSGPGATTLPVYVFSMVRMGVTPSVNAVSTVLIGLSIMLVTFAYLLDRFTERKQRGAEA